MLTMFNN